MLGQESLPKQGLGVVVVVMGIFIVVFELHSD